MSTKYPGWIRVKYVAGYTLYKTTKHKNAKDWGPAIEFLTNVTQTESDNEYFDMMNKMYGNRRDKIGFCFKAYT